MALQVERHVADLIEEQRAAIGILDLADRARGGAGKGAFFVAEQFRGDQAGAGWRRSSRATNGPMGAAGAVMDGAGQQFLAGAAFAGDQHGFVGLLEAADQGGDAGSSRRCRRRCAGSGAAVRGRVVPVGSTVS